MWSLASCHPPPNSASFKNGVEKQSSSGNLTLLKTLLGEGPLVAWTEIPKLGKTPRGDQISKEELVKRARLARRSG